MTEPNHYPDTPAPRSRWWTTTSFQDVKRRHGQDEDDVALAMAEAWAKQLYGDYGVVGCMVRIPDSVPPEYRVFFGERWPGEALEGGHERKLVVRLARTQKPPTP